MIVWTLAALFLAITALLAAAYWGAGIILHPPLMSSMEVFPEQFGLPYEKIAFKTPDHLKIKGWFIPSPEGETKSPTLLMCHGWGDNKGDLLKMTYFLNKDAGFNLFYFDHRSHGESEGEITTIGPMEMMDFSAAMNYLKKHKAHCLKNFGVFGLSMGASVATMGMLAHPEIKAAVLESPFIDYKLIVRQWTWNNLRIPYYPLIPIVLWMTAIRSKISNIHHFSPIHHVHKIASRPLLIIGGSEDRLMPESTVRAFYKAAKEPKLLWIVHGAAHAKCHETASLEYEHRVTAFFNQHLRKK